MLFISKLDDKKFNNVNKLHPIGPALLYVKLTVINILQVSQWVYVLKGIGTIS